MAREVEMKAESLISSLDGLQRHGSADQAELGREGPREAEILLYCTTLLQPTLEL